MKYTSFKRIVGLTGGMGAGKSTLVELIREYGIQVFDTDATVHALYNNQKIADYVGNLIGLKSPVNRQMVSEAITKNPTLLPIVEKAMMGELESRLIDFYQESTTSFVVIDAPLLFESEWDKVCDFVIAIQCPIEIRQQRVMLRSGMTREKMNLLMGKQISEEERLLRSHFIIHNTGTIEEAKVKMVGILNHLVGFYKNEG